MPAVIGAVPGAIAGALLWPNLKMLAPQTEHRPVVAGVPFLMRVSVASWTEHVTEVLSACHIPLQLVARSPTRHLLFRRVPRDHDRVDVAGRRCCLPRPFHVAQRRLVEQARVLAAELRGVLVADTEAGAGGVEILAQQEAAGLARLFGAAVLAEARALKCSRSPTGTQLGSSCRSASGCRGRLAGKPLCPP